ncbi:hypothetical protein [Altererythrobacter sp. CC-YST694]|nr:hypothetical protein [Altererythrobacter sp. CC-YST694]
METERKMIWRGVATGTLMGLGLGGILALFIALRPEMFAGLAG